MLFSIFADRTNFGQIGFDRDESFRLFGDKVENQFDVNWRLKEFSANWQPMTVNFADEDGGYSKDIPDISEHHGRLFLSPKAYDLLFETLKDDGEFLPVTYEKGQAYMFNPLCLAESVEGLNSELSTKDEFDDITNIAFHADKVSDFTVFKSEFNYFSDLFCLQAVKDLIESEGLKGVWFTPDLGNRYSTVLAS